METSPVNGDEGETELHNEHTIQLSCPACRRTITAMVRSSCEEIELLDLECVGAEQLRAPGDIVPFSPHAPTLMILDDT